MFVNEDEMIQCIAESDILGAWNDTLNASLLVEAGVAMEEVSTGAVVATEDVANYKVLGLVAGIGPGNAGDITSTFGVNQVDIFDGDIFAAQRKGKGRGILEAGSTVGVRTPLACAGSGKLKPATLSATATVEEEMAIVAYSEEVITNNAADVGISVVMAL